MSKIKELEKKISEAAEAYYNGSEILSDDEYDAALYELSCLDPTNKLLGVVGAEPSSKEWKKEKHLFPLGSLNKLNTPSDMTKWITDNLSGKPVLVAEKLDGLSIGCQYDNGKLTKAILRGGGEGVGENIFVNAIKMKGVVKSLTSLKGFTGVVRGEIILTKSDHQKHFPEYSNPRNAASGLCRRSDGEGCEHLTLMMYDVLGYDELGTEEDKFWLLKDNGFLIPNYKLCKTAKEVNELWQVYQDKTRASLDYEIDGLVVSCNDIPFQQAMGETNLRPKGKMAFKFANQFVKTTVKEITWQVGNSGRITPVCWFEPVNLLGSNVEKASAYNVAYIEKLGLGEGADVLICKAGEIIPRVEKVVKVAKSIANIPTHCPDCESELEMIGENLTCTNTANCSSQVIGRLRNWIKELNVLEWGDGLLTKLVEAGKVETIADMYRLSVDDLASIERMGEKSAKKCYDTLWAGSEVSLDTFLGALSIPMIGASTIRLLINAGADTLEKIGSLTANQFEQVQGIGPTRAKSLYDGLRANKDLINDLLDTGVKIKKKVKGKLTGSSICFTGSMVNKRPVLEQMAADAGAEIKGSVGKSLTYLVIADVNSTSSKAVSARKFGTKLLSEEDFLSLVG